MHNIRFIRRAAAPRVPSPLTNDEVFSYGPFGTPPSSWLLAATVIMSSASSTILPFASCSAGCCFASCSTTVADLCYYAYLLVGSLALYNIMYSIWYIGPGIYITTIPPSRLGSTSLAGRQ